MPKTRVDFWTTKFFQNVARDRRNEDLLSAAGWRVITIWECETRNREELDRKLRSMFNRAGDISAVNGGRAIAINE